MKYLYDTNVFLHFLAGKATIRWWFAEEFLSQHEIVTSAIVRMELLSFPDLTDNEDSVIREMLSQFRVIPISEQIENLGILLRRRYRLRIPDAVIAATAFHTSSTLVTGDVKDFKRVNEIRILDPLRS